MTESFPQETAGETCPACVGAGVSIAFPGRQYPVYWCAECSSYFCRPPARLQPASGVHSDPGASAAADTDQSASPEGGQGWSRTFGDVHVTLRWSGGQWLITISDGAGRCLLETTADSGLDEAKAKAERLVGYSGTTAWEETKGLPPP
jgi:hypothetical protein